MDSGVMNVDSTAMAPMSGMSTSDAARDATVRQQADSLWVLHLPHLVLLGDYPYPAGFRVCHLPLTRVHK